MIQQIFICFCLLHKSSGFNGGRVDGTWNDWDFIKEVFFLVQLAQVALIVFISLAVLLMIYMLVRCCAWAFKKVQEI